MITIRAKKDGFRRCGIAHSKDPVEYPADRFSTEELETLRAEPNLIVIESEGAKEPAKKSTKSVKS